MPPENPPGPPKVIQRGWLSPFEQTAPLGLVALGQPSGLSQAGAFGPRRRGGENFHTPSIYIVVYIANVWAVPCAVRKVGYLVEGQRGCRYLVDNIVWVCPVLAHMSGDIKIWDKYGPQRTKGCLMEFEVGMHAGA